MVVLCHHQPWLGLRLAVPWSCVTHTHRPPPLLLRPRYIRSGTHSVKPALPYTPGGDAAGVVTAVGPGVTSVKVSVDMSSMICSQLGSLESCVDVDGGACLIPVPCLGWRPRVHQQDSHRVVRDLHRGPSQPRAPTARPLLLCRGARESRTQALGFSTARLCPVASRCAHRCWVCACGAWVVVGVHLHPSPTWNATLNSLAPRVWCCFAGGCHRHWVRHRVPCVVSAGQGATPLLPLLLVLWHAALLLCCCCASVPPAHLASARPLRCCCRCRRHHPHARRSPLAHTRGVHAPGRVLVM